jgi:hypothetical protein
MMTLLWLEGVNCTDVDQDTDQWQAAVKIVGFQVPQSEGNFFTS